MNKGQRMMEEVDCGSDNDCQEELPLPTGISIFGGANFSTGSYYVVNSGRYDKSKVIE